ncbi:hypothetical protein BCR34DRAFT_568358 [Clohesyomyces aquaticus]|uniref:Rhodopsin domain-containing protein n=1 Tax=Clohesyomyces aquaticus TaxID=1231657 RepID=A0A1Y1ZGN4_9PLEO|nr:hypothetical protein BCR34DRAFT_568358 [Clohesyomyces aquaticus]
MVGQAKYGWDRHGWEIPVELISTSIVLSSVAKLLFTCCASFTRLSFLFFYYRLTKPLDMRRFQMLLCVAISLVLGILVAAFFSIFLLCSPVQAYWTFPPIPGSKCIRELPVQLTMGSLHTFADFVVTVLPIPIIMKLQMSRSKRVGTLSMLSLGFAITAAGCVRTYYSWYASTGNHDLAWDSWFLAVAVLAEVNLGLMCCCAPTIRVLIAKRVAPVLNSGLAKLSSSRQKGNSVSSESYTEKKDDLANIKLPGLMLDSGRPGAC